MTRRQHVRLHLQLRSGRLRSGKQVGHRGNLHHLRNGGDFGFLERIPENRRECRQYTHKHWTCSAAQLVHRRGTHRTRLAQVTRIAVSSLCAWKESVIWSAHVSPFVVLPPAVQHEQIFFLICSSSYHDTRTRTTIGTTRSTPRTPSASSTSPSKPCRKASLSRTTLAWKPAEWLKPAQHLLHTSTRGSKCHWKMMWKAGKNQKAWVFDWAITNLTAHKPALRRRRVPVLYFAGAAPKMMCNFKQSTERVGLKMHPNILGNQRSNKRKEVDINNIKVEIWPAWVSECVIVIVWASYYRYEQEQTSKSYSLQHRLRLFNMVITPTLSYWQMDTINLNTKGWYDQLNAKCFASSSKQRDNTKRRHDKNGEKEEVGEKENHRSSDEETAEGSSSNTDCDQDSDFSFMKDTDEEIDRDESEEEDWIEYMKRSTAVAGERMNAARIPCRIETHRRMRWYLAMRIASPPDERGTKQNGTKASAPSTRHTDH